MALILKQDVNSATRVYTEVEYILGSMTGIINLVIRRSYTENETR